MRIDVLAFARVRELAGFSQRMIELSPGACVADAWDVILAGTPTLATLRASTRIACNGKVVGDDRALAEGDELALLPPVGGG